MVAMEATRAAPAERHLAGPHRPVHVDRRSTRPHAPGPAPHRDARGLAELHLPGGPDRPAAAHRRLRGRRDLRHPRGGRRSSAAGCAASTGRCGSTTPTPAASTASTTPSCCCGCTARRSPPTWRSPAAPACGSPTGRPTATSPNSAAAPRYVGLHEEDVPGSRAEMEAYFAEMRPRLKVTPEARAAVRFLLWPKLPDELQVPAPGQAGVRPVRRALLLLAARLGPADVRHPAGGSAARGDRGAAVVPAGGELPARGRPRPVVPAGDQRMLAGARERLAAEGYDLSRGLYGLTTRAAGPNVRACRRLTAQTSSGRDDHGSRAGAAWRPSGQWRA